jgi:hypothetical protein
VCREEGAAAAAVAVLVVCQQVRPAPVLATALIELSQLALLVTAAVFSVAAASGSQHLTAPRHTKWTE